ncbi:MULTISPECIES: carbohydrate kinase family protein [Klebsiella]|nr:carbohydrate kinase family protein [Klebsiella pneumoniae]MCP5570771.1 carbohydrate kinase family protein [Klebsiella pneumoniae]MCP5817129.1 carbohydrate kinase family protein [Klebsiella pneumoniae]MCP6619411.1 carbohydrate kinase family protein [Klebsiella pneumoniae]MCP6707102.1 carbohydrate kinase family protein [Klebsiella pneumoniae]MDM7160304.1 carbohydrate kinase family protein [Klebsiella pneumoniae]
MIKKYDVVAVGSGNIDLVFRVPRLPGNDDKVVGKKISENVGGTVANSACMMSTLGLKVVSLSSAGDDRYGQLIVDDFNRHGVDTRYIKINPGQDPNMAIIILDESGEKSLIYAPGDNCEWDQQTAFTAIAESKIMYTMPGDLEKYTVQAQYARSQNTLVAVDIEPHIASDKEQLAKILNLADIAIFNQDGFTASSHCDPEFPVLHALRRKYSLSALVVTCGADGVIAVSAQEEARHSGFKIPVIDTTGAGDTFNASFIYTYANHYSLAPAIEFASAAAALNIMQIGARGHLASIEEITHFISSTKGRE